MGLINNKKVPKKPTVKKVPTKKVPKKPTVKPMVNDTVEPNDEQLEEQMDNIQIEEQIVNQVDDDSVTNNNDNNTDVNADEKVDVYDAEDLENNEKSENENLEEENNDKEPIPIEDLETVKEKKSKKKITKETKKTKIKEDEVVDDDKNRITDFSEATEYLRGVINFSSEEWEQEKELIRNKVQSICISTDLTPDSAKKLISQLSETYTSLMNRLQDSEQEYRAIEKQIRDIKIENSIGTNKQERDINALKAVKNYKKNKNAKIIDLELYFLVIQDKVTFFKGQADIVEKNRQLLITFSSLFKIEINNY